MKRVLLMILVIVIAVSIGPIYASHQNSFPPTEVEDAFAVSDLSNVVITWNQPVGGVNFDDSSLKAYYKFDETGSDTAKDSSLAVGSLVGLNQNETLRGDGRTNSMQGVTGKFGTAFDFPYTSNGFSNNKRIMFGQGNQWNFLNTKNLNEFSLSFWYRTSDTANEHYLIQALGSATGNGGIEIRMLANTKQCAFLFNLGTTTALKTSNGNCIATDNIFHFYTFVYSPNTIKIYRDGNLFQIISGTVIIDDDYSNTAISVGDWKSITTNPARGVFDEFAFWNKGLSQTEVSSFYNNGAGLELDVISSPDTYTIFRNSELIVTITTPATSYVDSTVAQNTDYVYGIQGNNQIGSSLIVNTNIVSTNSKPSSPQYVTPNKISSSQTIMLWIKPVDDGKGNPSTGLNLSYDVFRKNILTNEDFIQIADGIHESSYLDTLTTDSYYGYVVMAKNELGGTNSTIEPQVTSVTCAPGTTLNTTTNQCEADPVPQISCAPGTTLNTTTNQCEADPVPQISCGIGTILMENECVVDISLKNSKITLCHKNKETIRVSFDALVSHIAHGDQIGFCNDDHDGDERVDEKHEKKNEDVEKNNKNSDIKKQKD